VDEVVGQHLLQTQKEIKKSAAKSSMAERTNSTNASSIKASMAASTNYTSNKSSNASLQSAPEAF
jgi:hypothetical protein